MNKTKTIKKILTVLTFFLIVFSYLPKTEAAATATLYMSPSSLTRTIGSVFTANVNVNTGGQSANAFEASINAPGNILSVTGASSGGSICSLFIQQPTITGSTTTFKCGLPNGFNGNSKLISISFRGTAPGRATVTINNAKVLANDGHGTPILAGTVAGVYTISAVPPPATSAPLVTSPTHPDQNAWYKNNKIQLNWARQSGVTGFSYIMDQSPGTNPAAVVNTNETGISFDKPDGVWYLHIRAKGKNGWSWASHFRIQIDTASPINLTITSDPKKDADRRPMISFNAIDATSGIAKYMLELDKSGFKAVNSPYIPTTITSGQHTFKIRAFDKAGNFIEGSYDLNIKTIPKPKITSPKNNTIFRLAEKMTIEGTAEKGTTINIYFDGLKINKKAILVGENGKWSYAYENFIMPGKHNIFAVTSKDGIESQPSDKINFRIDPAAVSIFGLIIPSYLVFLVLLFLVGVLLLIIVLLYLYLSRKIFFLRKKAKSRNSVLEKQVEKEFYDMEKEVRREIDSAYETESKSPADRLKAENRLEDKLEEEIETTEKKLKETINSEKMPEGETNPKFLDSVRDKLTGSNKDKDKLGVIESSRRKLIDILEKPDEGSKGPDEKFHGRTKNEDFPDDRSH